MAKAVSKTIPRVHRVLENLFNNNKESCGNLQMNAFIVADIQLQQTNVPIPLAFLCKFLFLQKKVAYSLFYLKYNQ